MWLPSRQKQLTWACGSSLTQDLMKLTNSGICFWILCIWMLYFLFTTCMPVPFRNQKRASDSLELKLNSCQLNPGQTSCDLNLTAGSFLQPPWRIYVILLVSCCSFLSTLFCVKTNSNTPFFSVPVHCSNCLFYFFKSSLNFLKTSKFQYITDPDSELPPSNSNAAF